jgi:hypothetical protein
VITNGYGPMYSYASRIPVADRWAIIAYIRALQISQSATTADVPEGQRGGLASAPAVQPQDVPGQIRPQDKPDTEQRPKESKPEGVR